MRSLYVHIPFCSAICTYCDFAVLSAPERVQREYVCLLLREASIRCAEPFAPQTLYLGGGTPSALAAQLMDVLLDGLTERGLLHPGLSEFTAECNPESTDENWLQLMQYRGVNRFSLGVQTLQDPLLRLLRRRHTAEQALKALRLLVESGARVNADLMFDLPGQDPSMFLLDLERVTDLGVGHISFYGLSLEANTLLEQQVRRGVVRLNEGAYEAYYMPAVDLLSRRGLMRYEVSNFARPGQESLHNQHYWARGEYIGLGPGAHSYTGGLRRAAPAHFRRWAQWVEAGCPASGMVTDSLNPQAEQLEILWLGLRRECGISRPVWDNLRIAENHARVRHYFDRGWLVSDSRGVRVHGLGWIYLDAMVADLASVLEYSDSGNTIPNRYG